MLGSILFGVFALFLSGLFLLLVRYAIKTSEKCRELRNALQRVTCNNFCELEVVALRKTVNRLTDEKADLLADLEKYKEMVIQLESDANIHPGMTPSLLKTLSEESHRMAELCRSKNDDGAQVIAEKLEKMYEVFENGGCVTDKKKKEDG